MLLHQHTGHDFSRYKESTLVRRIQWRLQVQHAASVTEYISSLERDPPREAGILFNGLLIDEPVVQHLESEPRTAREELQTAVEEVESSNEELKAANEELITANMELQSANAELQASQEELRHSEHRYGALFSGMEEGVAQHRLIRDARGEAVDYEVLDVNPAYEAILGLSRAQVIGKRATELYGTPEAPYLAEYARVVETGIPCRFETCFAQRNQHFLISCVSPAPGVFATIFQDITEHKRVLARIRVVLEKATAHRLSCAKALDARTRRTWCGWRWSRASSARELSSNLHIGPPQFVAIKKSDK